MGLGFELEDFNGFRVSGFRMNSGADGCMLPMLCMHFLASQRSAHKVSGYMAGPWCV